MKIGREAQDTKGAGGPAAGRMRVTQNSEYTNGARVGNWATRLVAFLHPAKPIQLDQPYSFIHSINQ